MHTRRSGASVSGRKYQKRSARPCPLPASSARWLESSHQGRPSRRTLDAHRADLDDVLQFEPWCTSRIGRSDEHYFFRDHGCRLELTEIVIIEQNDKVQTTRKQVFDQRAESFLGQLNRDFRMARGLVRFSSGARRWDGYSMASTCRQPACAMGIARRPVFSASRLAALPFFARHLMPCRIAAMRNMLNTM